MKIYATSDEARRMMSHFVRARKACPCNTCGTIRALYTTLPVKFQGQGPRFTKAILLQGLTASLKHPELKSATLAWRTLELEPTKPQGV